MVTIDADGLMCGEVSEEDAKIIIEKFKMKKLLDETGQIVGWTIGGDDEHANLESSFLKK